MSLSKKRRYGVTMLELLVVLGILAFLAALLVPAVAKVRSAAARTQSMNNLRQLTLAMHSVNDVFKQLPPTVGSFAQPNSHGTLFFYLLPYIEQDNLYKQALEAGGSVWNNGTYKVILPIFINPKDASAPPQNLYKGWLATSSYAANWMVFKQGGAAIPRSFPDGTSNTIVLAERYQMCNGQPCAWGYSSLYYWAPMFAYYSEGKFQHTPSQEQCNPALAQSTDPAGIQVGLGDGSVRIVAESISPRTWWFACDPADGMPLGPDW